VIFALEKINPFPAPLYKEMLNMSEPVVAVEDSPKDVKSDEIPTAVKPEGYYNMSYPNRYICSVLE